MIDTNTITKDERLRILRELQTVKCFCGRKKGAMKSFCPRHYSSLPVALKKALYIDFGVGYEEAYQAAREWLKANS